jgi:hypothetical protein
MSSILTAFFPLNLFYFDLFLLKYPSFSFFFFLDPKNDYITPLLKVLFGHLQDQREFFCMVYRFSSVHSCLFPALFSMCSLFSQTQHSVHSSVIVCTLCYPGDASNIVLSVWKSFPFHLPVSHSFSLRTQ